MICINGYCDWTNSCHGVSQGLLISFGYEPVVFNMSNGKSAVVITGLGILLSEDHNTMLKARWKQNDLLF